MQQVVTVGGIDISLPSATLAGFSIFEDLADLLGTEFQSDAVEIIRDAIERLGLRPRPTFDSEADRTQIASRDRRVILHVVRVIHERAHRGALPALSEPALVQADQTLAAWKRPIRQKWIVGDVLVVPTADGRLAFAQIVGVSRETLPICALFEQIAETVPTDLDEVLTSRTLAVVVTSGLEIADHELTVIANREPIASPTLVRRKDTNYSDSTLQDLANAFIGLEPWNANYDERYYEKMLAPGVGRSSCAVLLRRSAEP